MANNLISIIIPVYNVESYLRDCLNSVVNQSCDNFEVIVINDGSTDNGPAICEEFAAKHSNIKVIHQQNRGLGAARNTGLEYAHGEYIVFLDSDDCLHTDFCKVMYAAAEKENVPLVICHTARMNENGDVIQSERLYEPGVTEAVSIDELIKKVCQKEKDFYHSAAWGKIYHKSLFFPSDNRFPIDVYYEDAWLSMKLFLESGTFCIVSDVLMYYRIRDDSIMQYMLLKPNSLKDYIIQFADAVDVLLHSNSASQDTKLNFIGKISKAIGGYYFRYLSEIYNALALSDSFGKNNKFALFGAGAYGKRFRKLYLSSVPSENIIFIDNNAQPQGPGYDNSPLIHIEDYLNKYSGYKLIITTVYFFEVLIQLLSLNVIGDVGEILPNGGKTAVERAFVDGIAYFNKKLLVHDTYRSYFNYFPKK